MKALLIKLFIIFIIGFFPVFIAFGIGIYQAIIGKECLGASDTSLCGGEYILFLLVITWPIAGVLLLILVISEIIKLLRHIT